MCKVDGVEQRRQTAGLHLLEGIANLLGLATEGHGEVDLIVEFREKRLIVRTHSLEHGGGGIPRRPQLEIHAAADIECQPDRQGNVLAGEVGDGLLHAIVEQLEVLLAEAEDEAVHGIGNRNRDHHQIGLGPEARLRCTAGLAEQ